MNNVSDGTALSEDGRAFQAQAAATGNIVNQENQSAGT